MHQPFESFASIERLHQPIIITEKIHGTNAQIQVDNGEISVGSRTRWISPEDFESEDAAWTYTKERLAPLDHSETIAICAPFWQPIRLEKLLSRDEAFVTKYPASLPDLCRAYMEDLIKETEVPEDTLKLVKKNVFKAIKGMMLDQGYSA